MLVVNFLYRSRIDDLHYLIIEVSNFDNQTNHELNSLLLCGLTKFDLFGEEGISIYELLQKLEVLSRALTPHTFLKKHSKKKVAV